MTHRSPTAPPGRRSVAPLSMLRERGSQGRWSDVAVLGAAGALGTFTLSAGLLALGARVMARLPLVPQQGLRHRPDLAVRAVHGDRVHLDATKESSRAGLLALRQSGGTVHVRLGEVTGRPTPTTIARPLLAVDTVDPLTVEKAAVNGFFWAGTPQTAHGLPTEEVMIDSPVGQMPAWRVDPDPADGAAAGRADTWAILIHGHGSTRGEALRIIPLLHRLGLTSLSITYRNDTGAPASADRMHHLGAAEWEDAEAAIEYALAHGARRLVLVGWSMGGGIALRTSVRTAHRDRIAGLVLDSPAVDWQDILVYHATALKAPRPMRRLAMWMMTSQIGARLVRLHEPLALDEMTPAYYRDHLDHRTLLLHALDDATVPPAPSRELAALRPDLVTFVPFEGASHTREWNRDPVRYERLLAGYLIDVLGLDEDPAALTYPVRDPASPPGEESIGLRI
ncbi:alpha/beta hydrolase family protein [Brachybacterium sp. J153]|uniref:alpha/beta hydrolase family protein n=1 Tax=Brachybacterium sp. J153 TaxID=3116488 RepID=UPI002E7873CB|nr:alpha/beta fold hydrolase [Brachybacterium sp. J153]MEE1617656.1 alpha/beta fold hydrolase [Brachybacterium sp. J153]